MPILTLAKRSKLITHILKCLEVTAYTWIKAIISIFFFFELKLQYTRCRDMVRESMEDNLSIVIIMMGDDNHSGKT